MTVVSDYRALLSNTSWDSAGAGAAAILTYSFSAAATPYLLASNPTAAATFAAANASEQATVKAALAQWSAASGITFVQTFNTPGDIAFGFYNLATISGVAGEAGLGNFPSTGNYVDSNGAPQTYNNFASQGGDVYFDTSYQTNPLFFSDFAHIALHEIGHALGLKHPFDPATAGSSYTLDPALDNGSNTVMAYAGIRSATLGPLDIAAIQALYGTPTTATHPFTETYSAATESLTVTANATRPLALFGSGGDDVFYSLGQRDALSGGEGNDTFYLAGKPASVNGGSGSDTVITGLTYAAGTTVVQQDAVNAGTRYIYLPTYSDFQVYVNVATLVFTNGTYSTATNSFTSFDTVASPGTTNADAFVWNASTGGSWGNAANWSDTSTALTLLPPGANDVIAISGGTNGVAPATITGVGKAATVAVSSGYVAIAGTLGLGALSVGASGAAGLTVASGGSVAVSGQASVVQTAAQAAAGQAALTVAAGGTLQVGSLVLRGTGALQYAMTGSGAAAVSIGTALAGSPSMAVAADTTSSANPAMPNTMALADRTTALAADPAAPLLLAAPDPNDAPAIASGNGAGASTGGTAGGSTTAAIATVQPAPTAAAQLQLQASPAAGTIEVGTLGTALAGTLTIDPGRSLSGSGAIASVVVNNGTITATGGQLALTKSLSGTGALQIAAGSTLSVTGALPEAVAFIGAGGTLDLLNPTSTSIQPGAISGFVAGDTIEVVSGSNATSFTYQNTGVSTGTLTLTRGSAVIATLQLTGSYSATQFALSSHAGGVSDITVNGGDPLFDAAYYLVHNPDVAAAGVDPYLHYLTFGWKEGRDPSALFDGNYYLKQNLDVKAAGVDPLLHFEAYGWHEGRQPSLLFDDTKYLNAYPDVRAAGVDPLVHYMQYGQSEGRAAFLTGGTAAADLLINASYYDQQLGATLIPSGTAGAQQAAYAYDNGGWQAGLNPDALFDTKYYLSHNPDVAAAHVDPLLHYEAFGWKEGRDPSAAFSTNKYIAAYADIKAAGVDPLLHYVQYGQSEGRSLFSV